MRIVVLLSETGHPELSGELASLPARQRAERLRTLATVGLLFTKGRQPIPLQSSPQTPVTEMVPPRRQHSAEFSRIREQLRKNLANPSHVQPTVLVDDMLAR